MNEELQNLKSKVATAGSILIALPENPSQDIVAAALALYLSLTQSGKQASVVAASAPVVRDSHLVGVDKIATDVGGKNLVMTIGGPDDAVDKVTSNTEGGHLNLVIIPKKGTPGLTQNDVTFSYSGSAADLVIVVGAADLKDLGALAEKEHEVFARENLVNMSNQVGSFGSVNLTDPSSSNSELVTAVLQELALPLDVDIANNLMRGIEDATSGLSSPNMTADTFEALAVLYRTGARRVPPAAGGHLEPAPAKIVSDMPIVEPTRPAPQPSAQADWLKPKILTAKDKITAN